MNTIMQYSRAFTSRHLVTILVLFMMAGSTSVLNAQPAADIDVKPRISSPDHMTEEKWEVFSDQIVRALKSRHDGLQEGALRMIIQYGENLDVSDARYELTRIYRSAKNENLRRMAIVAMGSLQDDWAFNYLYQRAREEKSPLLRQTIHAVLVEQLAMRNRVDDPLNVASSVDSTRTIR